MESFIDVITIYNFVNRRKWKLGKYGFAKIRISASKEIVFLNDRIEAKTVRE